MKIFHLTDQLPGYHKAWGGAEQVSYRYIKLLADSGMVDVVVGTTKSLKPVKENYKHIRVLVTEDFFPESMRVYITGIKNRILSFDLFSFFNLLFILTREKPDVLHIHKANKISFSAILAARILKIKVILAMYDYWYLCPGGMLTDQSGNLCKKFHGPWCKNCDAITDFRFLLPITSSVRKPLFDFFYKFVDAFIVLSDSQKKILENYGLPPVKIFLIRQVFDFKKHNNSKTIKKNSVLFAGWLDPRKGLHVLIDALGDVTKKIPDAKLIVLEMQGIKRYKEKILKQIDELRLKNNVSFYGRLPKEKFNGFLRQAQVVIVPEQWENMSPVIIIEAMVMGKVIVASDIGGISEFINDKVNGFLTKRNDSRELAQKIIWILKNYPEASRLGEKAREDILKICDQRKITEDLLKLYAKV